MSSSRLKKLEEIMEKIGVKEVQDGLTSEKMRSCIDKLHYHIVVHRSQTAVVNPSQIKPKFLTPDTQKPDTSLCPREIGEVKRTISGCQACHDRTPDVWEKCSARRKL